ncbi:MAG: sodium:calcium antiporter [Promethearchaeota archaeon]|nr:MAG: sodium:calcium antiporter [Candidatus Lokiarchaeota archaeon]
MISLLLAILTFIIGLVLIIYSSMKAVKHSAILAAALGVSPLIIGVSLVSIGTDISEIFNSLVSCALGHADIDIGDSVGSDLTQLTLVFGILPLVTGMFYIHRKDIIILGACEILSLILIFTIVEKGWVTRLNGILLVGCLGIYIWLIYNANKESILQRMELIEKIDSPKSKKFHLLIGMLGFGGVTIAAIMIVQSVIVISNILNIHEYLISFFIVAIGTSLPQLAVDINALRLGHHQIAIGDIVGSCIVDSTLSIGIGHVVFNQNPNFITKELAIPTVLYTLIASFIVFITIAVRRKLDKKAGILFISLYFISYIFLFSFWLQV